MKLLEENITQTLNEDYLVETLNLNGKTILELGCGAASKTKAIAANGFDRRVIACEVDEIQHKKNLELNIDNIEFKLCGAQEIKESDESVDTIFLFKSFHHIPLELMSKALTEMRRVLKPNGLVYISEPLYQGTQNELISMFHDEKLVREKAFEAIKNSVDNKEFKLFKEIFFQSEVTYNSFEEFDKLMINATYNNSSLDKKLYKSVKEKFHEYVDESGAAHFMKPFRVDILQKV